MGTSALTFHLPDRERQSIIIGIQIGIPFSTDGFPKEKRINMDSMALVDTGSTGSCISRRFAAEAQLKAFKRNKIRGFHGISIVPVYSVDVLLPNGILLSNMDVAEFQSNNNFDFIIGMNILRMGDMALTNAKGDMVFSFRIPPAEKHIDFVNEEQRDALLS